MEAAMRPLGHEHRQVGNGIGPQQLSPELALVDPELAAWARAQLPDMPAARLIVLPSPAERPAAVLEHDLRAAGAGNSRVLLRVLPLAAAAVLAAGFLAGYASHGLFSSPESRQAEASVSPRPAPRAVPAGPVLAPADRPKAVPASPATGSSAKRPKQGIGAPASARKPPVEHSGATVKAPELVWAPAPQSDAYRVSLFRGGRRVYTTITRPSRVRLPLRWTYAGRRLRLERGSYRWVVWALTRSAAGYRERAAIVNASITF